MSKSAAEFKRLVRGLFARTSGSESSCCLFAFALPPRTQRGTCYTNILHNTMAERLAVVAEASDSLGQSLRREASILYYTTQWPKDAVVAEVSDSLGQSLQADDAELNVLGCQVDILGTNCDQCLSMVQCCFYVRGNHKAH